ncbi:hypothetical protein NDU88_005519 [Pleurodeles waltl]|uniref:Uncharacterized protein n=1 Tax=Pleurodeles waltl TaxID=8319 RepID=A0AAV7NRR7_PLEWA|nr:hypothetical protein NDU88_005519 [Pleurodeles waltl]
MLHLHSGWEIDAMQLEKRHAIPTVAAVNDASPQAARLLDTVQLFFNATSLGAENQPKACPDPRCPSGIDTSRSCGRERPTHVDPTRGGTMDGLTCV